MKGVDIEDRIWSRGTKRSLDIGQGHELLQRQERDHVVSWVIYSNGAELSCMVPKAKGSSRHIYLISEKHLTEKLRRLNFRRRTAESPTSVNNMIARTAMDSRSECRGTVEACMIRVARELDCLRAHIRLRDPDKSEDKIEGVEAGGKGRGSDDESRGT
ncbi:hypothetical protein B296_00044362 [Ensete ventricosum]|uniref:Uncharacterized protein n=1 Tax=Ensete ventricosum TaxID=4639 RepID=A0A426Z4Q5_ENSVE|nr:hypothetical protein B296_00044362 [Ensete ventricosum]